MKLECLFGGKWVQFSAPGSLTPEGSFRKVQITRDEKHPQWSRSLEGGPFLSVSMDKGPFTVQGLGTYYSKNPVFVSGFGSVPIRFTGGFYNPDFSGFDDTDSVYLTGSFATNPVIVPSLDPYYPLVAKMRPKIAEAGLGQAIAEIEDMPRTLKGALRGLRDLYRSLGGKPHNPIISLKRGSDEWLSYRFGALPLIKDVSDLLRVTDNYRAYVSNISDRNGRWDHLKRIYKNQEDITTVGGDGVKVTPFTTFHQSLCDPQANTGAVGQWSITTLTKLKGWFTGDFQFYVPAFDRNMLDYDSAWNNVQRAVKLYGADINPELLYDITPYSWLVDYVSNAGDVIGQLTDVGTNGVVSKNLYIMLYRQREMVFTQTLFFSQGSRAFSWSRKLTSKQRDHAGTPFGFGLDPNGLSGVQLSIVAALGIQKFR
jgi:hypothetical protein